MRSFIHAYHIDWTVPSLAYKSPPDRHMPDFELLTAALSVLCWQRHSGPVTLCTDRQGKRFYTESGLSALYEGVVWDCLPSDSPGFDVRFFWAGGKLLALDHLSYPACIIDRDLIVWQDISADLAPFDAAGIHKEEAVPPAYPDPRTFCYRPDADYHPPDEALLCLPALNTALLYLRDATFARSYQSEALSFMRSTLPDDPVTYMVYAEQRLLPVCAQRQDVPWGALKSLSDLQGPQRRFTHLWGYKETLRRDASARANFCAACLRRIRRDFSGWEDAVRYALQYCQRT